MLGASINFHDVTRYNRLHVELEGSKQELETAYEELQSTNEELETTNEELQSTNEELETMNEQLQASNREFQAVNAELRLRTADLNQLNAFLESILASLRNVAVILDRNFNVLMWNARTSELWGLRVDEVRGRSFLGLDIGLPVEQLRQPVRALLNGQTTQREFTLDAVDDRGGATQCQVICTPLIGSKQHIEGAILLMEEIHEAQTPGATPGKPSPKPIA